MELVYKITALRYKYIQLLYMSVDQQPSVLHVAPNPQDMFSPRNLANIAIALALRGVRDVPTVEFVRNEAIFGEP